jgi:hypothetical protein
MKHHLYVTILIEKRMMFDQLLCFCVGKKIKLGDQYKDE